MSVVVALLFFKLLFIATTNISFCYGSISVGYCIESERQALLSFKHDLTDPSNRLASWIGDRDCCTWAGVVCDNSTGHVLQLRLRNSFATDYNPFVADFEADHLRSMLGGKINPSLLNLKHLIYLDLSYNYFGGLQIPGFIGSIENLRYLNLSGTGFSGLIPHQLGNLSNLHYLDLGSNYNIYVENLGWLSGLASLKHLDLSDVNLTKASDNWPSKINMLSSLVVLHLARCQIKHFPPLSVANFSSLAAIDLACNYFENSLIPSWVFSLAHVVYLDLSFNRFQGPIPDGLKNLTSLKYLDLSNNLYNSSIPNWLYRFNHLEHLRLLVNSLQGTIPSGLGNLTSIKDLDLSVNRLAGRVPKSLGKACNLRSLSLRRVKLSQDIAEILNILSGCVADGLELLDLEDSQLFGHLTDQLGQLKKLNDLDLSYNSISGTIPSALGRLSFLSYLDVSYNKLNGTISQIHFVNLTRLSIFDVSGNSLELKVSPNWVPPFQLHYLRLRSCHLGSQFPPWLHSQKFLYGLDISNSGIFNVPDRFWKSLSQLISLNLSHNQIHGEIPNLTQALNLRSLDLSWNNFSGPLPLIPFDLFTLDLSHNSLSGSLNQFLCYGKNESRELTSLNLANNFLSGELHDCWVNWQFLRILNLGGNKFSGNLPTSMGTLTGLESLHLNRNSLSGEIPVSFANCSDILAFDVSENKFGSSIPTWIGEKFSSLLILNLRSNKFHGLLPEELCRLSSIQILDLASNNLSGTLPRCISNFSAMVTMNYSTINRLQYMPYTSTEMIVEDASLVTKGKVVEYSTILHLVRSVDLSLNNFSGEIPVEVTNLGALQTLNLSHNSFTGKIPGSIGDMRLLESIDFSVNQLSGEIPQSMSSLTFLSHLNLSDNNLTGKIPLSTQLQSLEASCFMGNELCGSPLPRNCSETVPAQDQENGSGEDHDGDEVNWFYVSMALGFVVGFWGVIGPLIVHRRWRYTYYRFLDRLGDKIPYVVRKHF